MQLLHFTRGIFNTQINVQVQVQRYVRGGFVRTSLLCTGWSDRIVLELLRFDLRKKNELEIEFGF